MTRKCRKCGQLTGPKRRICKQCSVEDRYGTPSDYIEDDEDDDGTESVQVECTSCGTEYEHDGDCACPDCGARRRRYIGPIGGQAVATDGGIDR